MYRNELIPPKFIGGTHDVPPLEAWDNCTNQTPFVDGGSGPLHQDINNVLPLHPQTDLLAVPTQESW